MSIERKKNKETCHQAKVSKDMAIPPGEHLVPLKTGLNADETWIKKLIKKTR